MITAITLTGDRPITFELLKRWVQAQSIKPDQWLVVDDGITPMEPAGEYIRREPQTNDPRSTMLLNLEAAIPRIKGDYILFLEDDEYYAPDYIKTMLSYLQRYEVVGIGRSKYYHVNGGYMRHTNLRHASLAQTAFNKSFLPRFIKILKGDPFLDIRLWEILNGKDASKMDGTDFKIMERVTDDKRGIIFDDGDNCLYVGIKGMPGRGGIGSGHIFEGYPKDHNFEVLKKWLKKDFQYYQKYLGHIHPDNNQRRRATMRYKALKRGYIKEQGVIEPGKEFDYEGKRGKWMVPVAEAPAAKPAQPDISKEKIYETARKVASKKGNPFVPDGPVAETTEAPKTKPAPKAVKAAKK